MTKLKAFNCHRAFTSLLKVYRVVFNDLAKTLVSEHRWVLLKILRSLIVNRIIGEVIPES
jgi:hypothetical protein